MIGYDFDGVVSTGRFKPTINDAIITGNTVREYNHVYDYLKANNIECAVYFMPDKKLYGNSYAVAVWKSEIISRLNCLQFFEDNQTQCEIIRGVCSECDVIKV